RFLRAVSVGFRPREFNLRRAQGGAVEGVEYTKQELLEISAVAVPANPHALAKALASGLDIPRLRPLFTATHALPQTVEVQADAIITALRGLRDALAG